MARDPEELYELDADAQALDGVVLLHHLDGFMDAGSAGGLVTEHLLEALEHQAVARFDVDRLIDYRSRRPPLTYARDRWESYEAPELTVSVLRDTADTPFLLLTGPEPDHEWELFIAAVRSLSGRLGARLTVGFHGIPMGAPHTRPLGITAHATSPDLISGYQPLPSRLQVPGSVAALLEFRLGEAGDAAAGLAVHVPHYLAQAAYPAAALTLLESVTRTTGLTLPDDALREASRRTDAEIARQVQESDEVAELVRALERQYDAFADTAGRDNLLADAPMPTADELGAQFERFLAEQQGHTDP